MRSQSVNRRLLREGETQARVPQGMQGPRSLFRSKSFIKTPSFHGIVGLVLFGSFCILMLDRNQSKKSGLKSASEKGTKAGDSPTATNLTTPNATTNLTPEQIAVSRLVHNKTFRGAGAKHLEKPSLHLLGERHSGTNWLTKHLESCFGDNVDIVVGFSDWKHWFQWEEPRFKSAVVVAQFRNVYNWVHSMRINPYHAPRHFNLDWYAFLTKPWTMPRYRQDLPFEGVTSANETDSFCRRGDVFKPHQVIPCVANPGMNVDWDNKGQLVKNRHVRAFYELRNDGSGLPYNNILELRADKIRNFLALEKLPNVKAFHHVRYEEMSKNGTEQLIRELERELNVTATCSPVEGQLKREPVLNAAFFDYLTWKVDWETEALVGYKPRDQEVVNNRKVVPPQPREGHDGSTYTVFHGRSCFKEHTYCLSLVGERHSGTNWITDHLIECFGDDVNVVIGFSDHKHWFQSAEPRYHDHVVIAQFRNVYNWVEAMRTDPYHSPMHFNLEWQDFVTKPWTMPRYDEDLMFEGSSSVNKTDVYCLNADMFQPHQVIPCVAQANFFVDFDDKEDVEENRFEEAFYELRADGSGLPYNNILELRADKIRNFVDIGKFDNVKAFHHVQYEDLTNNGTETLIRMLERDLNVTAKCDPIVGRPKTPRTINAAFFDYLTANVDWEAEALVDYMPEETHIIPEYPEEERNTTEVKETNTTMNSTSS